MKLLFFIGSMRGGGAERVMSILCNELVNRGHDISLATMINHPSFYLLDKRINIISLDRRKGANIVDKIIWRLKWYAYIRRTVKKENPDIIISFIYGLNAPVILSTLFLGIPVIASEHTTFNMDMSFLDKIRRFRINRLAKKVTVLTKYDHDYIGNRLQNKVVMPNPLAFIPVTSINNDQKRYIVAAGSVIRYHIKGFDNLIKIWGGIAHKYPDWKLLIAGNSNESSLSYLESLAQRYNILHQIEFLGPVHSLDNILRESSIFVLSSRYEGFGMVLIEAMSQGCACISFDCISGPGEIITNNVDGILVPDQNMKEMEKSLSDLIEDKSKRLLLANNAIKSVNRFSVENIVNKWEVLFSKIIKE